MNKPTDWDRAYRKGTLRQPDPLPQLDPEFDNLLEWAVVAACCIVIGGIALVRIYSRLFLGPHIKTYHSTPLKSS